MPLVSTGQYLAEQIRFEFENRASIGNCFKFGRENHQSFHSLQHQVQQNSVSRFLANIKGASCSNCALIKLLQVPLIRTSNLQGVLRVHLHG